MRRCKDEFPPQIQESGSKVQKKKHEQPNNWTMTLQNGDFTATVMNTVGPRPTLHTGMLSVIILSIVSILTVAMTTLNQINPVFGGVLHRVGDTMVDFKTRKSKCYFFKINGPVLIIGIKTSC